MPQVADPLFRIFLRTGDKKGRIILLPNIVSQAHLLEVITLKTLIDQKYLKVFLHGQPLEDPVILTPSAIIHAIDLRKVGLQRITVAVRRIDPKDPTSNYELKSQQKIGELFQQILVYTLPPTAGFFLIYTGRKLRAEKTFSEEFVQDGSEIICVSQSIQLETIKDTIPRQKKNKQSQQPLRKGAFQGQNQLISVKKIFSHHGKEGQHNQAQNQKEKWIIGPQVVNEEVNRQIQEGLNGLLKLEPANDEIKPAEVIDEIDEYEAMKQIKQASKKQTPDKLETVKAREGIVLESRIHSLADASHKNLELICHIPQGKQPLIDQDGVTFETVDVKRSPNTQTSELLVYQQQLTFSNQLH